MNGLRRDASAGTRADTAASHERAVHRVIAAMRQRLDEELSLREMADVAIMSPFHFNRTFHTVTGLPPRHFLSALRLERARHLLVTTQERVTDVCLDVGYNSLGTFTRRFTETFGVSPRRLRSYASLQGPVLPVPTERPAAARPAEGGFVCGRLFTPPEFRGIAFIGLFRSSFPCGAPAACTVLSGAGEFALGTAAGRYHLYALGIRHPATPLSLVVFDDALRAAGGVVEISATAAPRPVDLVLRPPAEVESADSPHAAAATGEP